MYPGISWICTRIVVSSRLRHLYGCGLTSSSPLGTSKLPIAVWEAIIDQLGAEYRFKTNTYYTGRFIARTLCACALVCSSWRDRSRQNLYSYINIKDNQIPEFRRTLRMSPHFQLSHIKKMLVHGTDSTRPISQLLTMVGLINLSELDLDDVNLRIRPELLSRGPLFRSLRSLSLNNMQQCEVASLIRLINSAPRLKSLTLAFHDSAPISIEKGTLPRPLTSKTGIHPPSLSYLYLGESCIPYLNELIEWYAHSELPSFFGELEELKLYLNDDEFAKKLDVNLRVAGSVLKQCSPSLMFLNLYFGGLEMMDALSDIGMLSMIGWVEFTLRVPKLLYHHSRI